LSVYEDVPDMEAYCDKYVRRMGEDAEGAFLELGLLPSLLRTSCVIHNVDVSSSQREIECPYTHIRGSCLGSIHILLRPGHYDLLYPMGSTFSPPFYAQFVSTEESKAACERDQPVDLLTGANDCVVNGPETDNTDYSADAKDTSEFDSAVSEFLEMCPDLNRSFALTLLQRFDYDVGDAINEYFSNQESYMSQSSTLLDLKAEEKGRCSRSPMHKVTALPTNAAAKDRIYETLRLSFPEVPIEDLHAAVHEGNAADETSTRRFLTALAENRYHGEGKRE